jgi:hypothetical protein
MKLFIEILIALVPCLIIGYIAYRSSRKMQMLKAKAERYDFIFKLITGHDDPNSSFYTQVSLEYLIVVQQLKDETTFLLGNHSIFPEKVPESVAMMRDKIIKSFSSFYPVFADRNEIWGVAHQIKRIYVDDIFKMVAVPDNNNEELEQLLNSISSLQVKLAQLLKEEIDLMIRKLQTSNDALSYS